MELRENTTGIVTRRRKGTIWRVRTNPKCDHEYWQAALTVDGKCMVKTSKDRAVVEAWLRDRLREHPTYLCGPRRRATPLPVEVTPVETVPVEVEVGTSPSEDAETLTAALPSVHIKWRPDLGLELVRGHDPADVGRALGWDAARTGRALDLLVEKGRIVVHVTKWGPLYQPVTKKVAV